MNAPSSLDARTLAKYIDHTQLSPEAGESDIRKVCEEARQFGFKTVCIYRKWLPLAVRELEGVETIPITVIGFPGGDMPTEEKVAEAEEALGMGARELDMVLNRGLFRKDSQAALADIRAVVEAAGSTPVKVILETSELSESEIQQTSALSKEAGAAFVKTSTGFSSGGASLEAVTLMRETVGKDLGVKASGGIRNTEAALAMIRAGATRLGTSASVAIVTGAGSSGGSY